jgi:hypothetical protein
MKAQTVADNRLRGGSRFNLRWSGSISADQLTPEAIMKRLADYVDFAPVKSPDANSAAGNNAAPSAGNVSDQPTGAPTAQLKRGMKIEEVTALLGPGKQL